MKQVTVTNTIVISQNIEKIFELISDFTKDTLWRAKINNTTMSTKIIKKGTLIIEESFLLKNRKRR